MLRFLILLATLALTSLAPVFADGASVKPGLTVVLDLNGATAVSSEAIFAMKNELRTAMNQTGIAVEFMLREELTPHVSFEDLIVVQFKGRCEMDNFPILFDERGPNALAFTHSSEGEILPFS